MLPGGVTRTGVIPSLTASEMLFYGHGHRPTAASAAPSKKFRLQSTLLRTITGIDFSSRCGEWLLTCLADLFSSGSFFGGSFFSSSGSFSLGSGSCEFSFLLCYFFGFSLVLSYFNLHAGLSVELALGCHRGTELVNCLLLAGFPSVETALGLGFVKCAFLHTTLKVLHQKYTLVGEDCAHGVSGLSTYIYPIQSTLEVECYCSRISVRIIRTYPFNKSTISWCPAIGDNNRIERIVLATMALQSNFSCH